MIAFLQRLLMLLALGAAFAPCAVRAAEADDQARRQVEQPLNNAPVWREVRSGEAHSTQVQGVESGVLVQSGGETWRALRNGPITLYGGILLLVVPFLILGFYLSKGPIKVHGPLTGRLIQRFTVWERVVHWSLALTWLVLGLTGIVLLFGKWFLLPVVGYTAFSWLAILSKNLHNFVGPLFLVSAIAMFITFVGRNIPNSADLEWLAKGGGMFSDSHPPSGFFNGGEKIVFWVGLTLLSIVVGTSGLILNFPNFEQGRWLMQTANVVHSIGALLYMAMIMGHIYLGSIGMEGAYQCMRHTGMVDEAWAKEHHSLWYEEVKRRQSARPEAQAPAAGSVQHTA